MRVLHISNSPYPSLAEVGPSGRIFAELARDAEEYHVLAYTGRRRGARGRDGKIQLHALPLRRGAEFAVGSFVAVGIARRLSIDVIVCQDPLLGGIAGLAAGRIVGVPVLLEVHTDVYFESGSRRLSAGHRMTARIAGFSLRHATAVRSIGPSSTAALMRIGVAEDRVITIPNRVDCSSFIPNAEERSATRAALGIPPGAPLIVSSGRYVAQKGYNVLLAAFARLRRSRSDARLALAGDGPTRTELQAQIGGLGIEESVDLLGWLDQPELARILAAADAYAQPSLPGLGEWMPRSILEAMAVGLPVVATPVGGIPDVIDREVGVLVPSGEPNELARALLELINDPGRSVALGRRGRERVRDRYAWDQAFDRYRAALAALAQDR